MATWWGRPSPILRRMKSFSFEPKLHKHPESSSVLRPEVGVQPQFKKTKPPKTYRYDSSLSPAMEWDGQIDLACSYYKKYLHNRAHGVASSYDEKEVRKYLAELTP